MNNLTNWAKANESILTVVGMALICLLILLVEYGCQTPINTTTPTPAPSPSVRTVTIKNSLWKDVQIETVARSVGRALSRSVSDSELLAVVDDYNAETLDDFLRVYYDEAPSLEDSPPVSVYIVNPVTYAVNMAQEGIARTLLVDNAEGWRRDSYGQLLFIDHVPPPPIIVPPESNYAYFAIYAIDADGVVVYEDHCGYRPDESFDQADIGDYASPEVYYPIRINQIKNEVNTHYGWVLKADHSLYTGH